LFLDGPADRDGIDDRCTRENRDADRHGTIDPCEDRRDGIILEPSVHDHWANAEVADGRADGEKTQRHRVEVATRLVENQIITRIDMLTWYHL
jgi:hypothetical protein